MLTEEQQQTITHLLNIYRRQMYGRAYAVLQNHEDTEDAVQDSLIKIARNLDRIEPELNSERNRLYILVIVYHTAIDIKRRRVRGFHLISRFGPDILSRCEDETSFDDLIFQSDAVDALIQEVRATDAMAARVYVYKHVFGFTHSEIAAFLGISVSRSQKLVHKALKIMRGSDTGKSIRQWLTTILLVLLAIVLLAACTLLVRYIKTLYEQKAGYEVTHDSHVPASAFDVGYVVDGYTLADTLRDDTFAMYVYENEQGQMYTVTIYTDPGVHLLLDTENGTLANQFINGNPCEIYTFENKDTVAALFLPNGTVEVVGPISQDEIISIMQSITYLPERGKNEKAVCFFTYHHNYCIGILCHAGVRPKSAARRRTH